MPPRSVLVVAFAVSLLPACRTQWSAEVAQPRLLLGATQEARTSMPLEIVMRDSSFPRSVKLVNSAYYVVVSKDRFRFHVTLHHKWDDHCDLRTWRVWVEDSAGTRLYPEDVDQRPVYALNLTPADTHYVGWNGTVYRGDGDITIYRRELLGAMVGRLTLVLSRPGYEYRYVWTSPAT